MPSLSTILAGFLAAALLRLVALCLAAVLAGGGVGWLLWRAVG